MGEWIILKNLLKSKIYAKTTRIKVQKNNVNHFVNQVGFFHANYSHFWILKQVTFFSTNTPNNTLSGKNKNIF